MMLRRDWAMSVAVTMLLGLVSLTSAGAARAADGDYPTRAIDLVVTFPPGGASDQAARIAADYLSRKWGRPINVVNRPGGSGVVGVTSVLMAPPDGYTIMLHSFANTAVTAVQADAPYKWDSLNPIGLLASSPMALTVPADSPWKSLPEALDAARRNPEAFTYGVGGVAAPSVIAFAKLFGAAEIDSRRLRRVMFTGGAPTLAANAGGHVTFASQTIAESRNLIEAGKLRALIVGSRTRLAEFPDVPTAAEVGYPDYGVPTWLGFSGPPKLPEAVVRSWSEGLRAASEDPEVIEKLSRMLAVVDYKTPAEFLAFCKEQYTTMRAIAKQEGLRK